MLWLLSGVRSLGFPFATPSSLPGPHDAATNQAVRGTNDVSVFILHFNTQNTYVNPISPTRLLI